MFCLLQVQDFDIENDFDIGNRALEGEIERVEARIWFIYFPTRKRVPSRMKRFIYENYGLFVRQVEVNYQDSFLHIIIFPRAEFSEKIETELNEVIEKILKWLYPHGGVYFNLRIGI